ncbi:hypothetical protein KC343_g6073 [Hortaea werneckii]|uniref:Uncharacterized protein n=1 Tax=Hortaea werneckii TaxID=91943 RepID=A0A3M7DN55_HORWE|nr:hypothetical protein KC317_g6299 [Hortaea werneckii]KAI7627218.1 hypothetical protein KC343_g6073 [Hortaea werneckii]KAI7670166.1 hypothetical protein KC319_g5954 [Hortaea werneckii]KAI7706230.1 hypothetical protein KC322_g5981 [Hortaea werneckii]RMY65346.1 hypothetical protein D0864_12118 [Hortaea werneckii]
MTSTEEMPWGSLPLERYVLAQWASLPSIAPDHRRRQLAQQFTAIGHSARVLHVARSFRKPDAELPPQADWESILAPLRTDFQRLLALESSFQPEGFPCFGIIWLRTCYDEGTDGAHQRLLNELNEEMALEVDQNILDDAALYNYGDDWCRIFEVVPERLLKEALDEMSGERPTELDARTAEEYRALIREEKRNPDINAAADTKALSRATVKLHFWAVHNYLFVADKVAFETGKALIVFFDDCGRTVRQSRIRPEFGEPFAGAWHEGIIHETEEFLEAEIGPEYLPGGSCGPPYPA